MLWITVAALLVTEFNVAVCFNIEPVAWRTLSSPAPWFGYQVAQRPSDLLVSAPMDQYSANRRGRIFKCTNNCQLIQPQGLDFAVNMSLGLSMVPDPDARNTLACGPTIPKDCKSITMYNGVCVQLNHLNQISAPVPPSLEDCQTQADIAFLLDGSGSVLTQEFRTMKEFVKQMVRPFLQQDTRFSISQFSNGANVHFYFDDFFNSGNWEYNIDHRIHQQGGGTQTARAIKYVVKNVFTTQRGSRDQVKKVLIVITDGESQNSEELPGAASLAEQKNIVRFAIGVGNAFSKTSARQELDTIASVPSRDHVFKVDNFNALEKIRETLREKIFSIEGSQSSGETVKMEMSQQGFAAAYTPQGFQLSVVGANQWKGGFVRYSQSFQKVNTYEPRQMEPDSYVGYSMAVAQTPRGTLTVVGAPRYKHRGIVMAVQRGNTEQKIDPFPWEEQTGEYFGAELCAMDMNSDGFTDLILISAPMHVESDREGRVYVCGITGLTVDCSFDAPLVLRGDAYDEARFGASLAAAADLNADGLRDLAVGAPLENNGQGSVYIFQGEGGNRISSTYSQRIDAADVQSGLKFFGMSISQSSFDHSGDQLTDLAVGSRGSVVILRTRPIVMVEATVTFNPSQIPTQNPDCTNPLRSTARICFTMTKRSPVQSAQATVNYTLTLDATRKVPNNRASINDKQREATNSVLISLGRSCFNLPFFIEPCPDDALNELNNELRFTFEGTPSAAGLRPSLAQQAQTTSFHPIGFEINCGADNECVDNLQVDFNFTSSSEVRVGIDELLNVTVALENSGENSYNSHVILTYPVGLSYRKFTSLQGRIECNSVDSENSITRGKTDCTINRPIFRSRAKAFFIISYGIEANSQLDRSIFITANATSGNQAHGNSNQLYRKKDIDVKYSIFMTIESLLSYSNFTYGKNDLEKPVAQSVKVTNDIRALNFTVVIKVPVQLGDKNIWANLSSLEIPDCHIDKDEEPTVKDFVDQIKKSKVVDCSVARCRAFMCSRFMGRLESKSYKISANLSSEWIEQIGLEAAKFLLTSTASLVYDRNQYIFFSTGTNSDPPVHKIEVEVEVYPEPDFTKEIVGGSLGGLAFLALLTAGLYKAGFFKSKYKEMINESAEGEGPEPEGAAAAPE